MQGNKRVLRKSEKKQSEDQILCLEDQEEAAAQRSEYETAAQIRTERLRLEEEYEDKVQ